MRHLHAAAVLMPVVGGAVPGSPASKRAAAMEGQLDRMSAHLEKMGSPPMDAAQYAAHASSVNELRDDHAAERARQWRTAAALYLLVGTILAVVFAGSYVEAFLIGGGWTALVGSLGLRQDDAARKEEKDAALVGSRLLLKQAVALGAVKESGDGRQDRLAEGAPAASLSAAETTLGRIDRALDL